MEMQFLNFNILVFLKTILTSCLCEETKTTIHPQFCHEHKGWTVQEGMSVKIPP